MKLEQIGQNIDAIRDARKWTMADLAKKVNLSRETVWNHIRTGRMSVQYLLRYSEALGCKPSDLVDGAADAERFELTEDIISYYPWNLAVAVGGFDLNDVSSTDEARNAMYGVYVPALEESLKTLTDREQRVLELRYQKGMTLEDTGREFHVTRERIRQVEQRALRKLRHPRNWKHWQFDTMEKAFEVAKERDKALLENAYLRRYLPKQDEGEEENIPIPEVNLWEMELSVRSYNCLARAGIKTLADFNGMQYEKLLKVRNLGRKSLEEVMGTLKRYGFEPDEDGIIRRGVS